MTKISDISLYDLLPPSFQQDQMTAAMAQSLDGQIQELNKEIKRLDFLSRLYTGDITDEEADEKAWEYHVDFYDTTLPLSQKIELLQNSRRFHQRKGTPAAIEDLITILFGEGKVEEWFEYDGQPGYFRVTTNNPEVTLDRAQDFYRAVESVKRLSAHLEEVILSQTESLQLYFGTGMVVNEHIIIS